MDKKHPVTVRLPYEIFSQVKELAERERRSINFVLNEIIENFFQGGRNA